jgi:hypothetical protein
MKTSSFTRIAALAALSLTAHVYAADLDASCAGAAAKLTSALEAQAGQQTNARQLQVSLRVESQRVTSVQVSNATPEQRRAVRSALLGMSCSNTQTRESLQFAVQMLPPTELPAMIDNNTRVAASSSTAK